MTASKSIRPVVCSLLVLQSAFADVSLNSASGFKITFDSTLSDVNEGPYTGSGLEPTPSAGRLDSDTWLINGSSDGNSSLGGTHITGDFARGSFSSGVTTGGLYGFDVDNTAGVNRVFGFQPAADDLTPGSFTLRVKNNTGATLNAFGISFDIWVRNDQAFATSLNASFSTDNITFTSLNVNFTSPQALTSGAPFVLAATRSTIVATGFSVPDEELFFIRWDTNDVSGSGSRDELALDNITVSPEPGCSVAVSAIAIALGRHRRRNVL